MTIAFLLLLTRPTALVWWQWGKIVGALVPLALAAAGAEHPLTWAIAAHLLVDFSFQGGPTAIGKAQGNLKVLAYHSFISGGYAGFIVGGLPGLAASVAIHFAIDCANKFGLPEKTGAAVDQALHVITLYLIWVMF